MVRITGYYRWQEGARFDHDYYDQSHMALTKEKLIPYGLLRLESDRFISATPLRPGDIIVTSSAYFESREKAQAAMFAVGKELLADVANYTDLEPEIRMSRVTKYL